jgi:hypothetical protein
MKNYKINIKNFALSCDLNYGKNWYKDNKNYILNLVCSYPFNQFNIDYRVYAAIVSILSPSNKWTNNLSDAYFLVGRFYGLITETEYKYYTYSSNVKKAIRLLETYQNNKDKNLDFIITEFFNQKSQKTLNFYFNLIDPENNNFFTIDRHMLKISNYYKNSLTQKQYLELKLIFKEVYDELILEKLFNESFSSFQACLWCNYVLKFNNIKH